MSKPRMAGFQKPLDTGERKKVRVAVIKYAEDNMYALCSCGQPFKQRRTKVREDAIDKHITKQHSGMGIRL